MNKLKVKLLTWVLKDLWKAITVEEVFTNLTPEQKENYALEAKQILEGKFYPEFLKLMEQLAISKMAREANTNAEMIFGKAVLWYVMTQRTKLKEFANYKPPVDGEAKKW